MARTMGLAAVWVAVLLALCPLPGSAEASAAAAGLSGRSEEEAASATVANPIRRVVQMLQAMQKKVHEESEKETELFEKFTCYCKTSGSELTKAITEAKTKLPQVDSDIDEAEQLKKQLQLELDKHREDRTQAKAAVNSATHIREKDHTTFSKEIASLKADLASVKKAVAALEKGAKGGFLQAGTTSLLRWVTESNRLDAPSEDLVTAFLTDRTQYAPQSGEVIGILKQLGDSMAKDIEKRTSTEEEAAAVFKALIEAKTKEIGAATASIESHVMRIGELGVSIVNMKEDYSDTTEALENDSKFLEDLEKHCSSVKSEWDEIVKLRSEELVALSETIKILNDDDALELFKKALPSPSLVQVNLRTDVLRNRALQVLRKETGKKSSFSNKLSLEFVALALGRKVSFAKVIQMIDDLVKLLVKEQRQDDEKKEYCEAEIESAELSLKDLDHAVDDVEKSIEDISTSVGSLKDQIETLIQGIKDLDNAVAEATRQRKDERETFTTMMAMDTAAVDVLHFAKNRLLKFYEPKLYKAPAKQEAQDSESSAPSTADSEGAGVMLLQVMGVPKPPIDTMGPYTKKGQESAAVISMLDMIITDLRKEMTEAKVTEKKSQEDYQEMMEDAVEKRAMDSTRTEDLRATVAGLESDLVKEKTAKLDKVSELMATEKYLTGLHTECDWLLKNWELRKTARADETDALNQAKAVLSGADFSLVQVNSTLSQ